MKTAARTMMRRTTAVDPTEPPWTASWSAAPWWRSPRVLSGRITQCVAAAAHAWLGAPKAAAPRSQAIRDQHAAAGTDRGAAVLAADAAAQLDDLAAQFRVGRHLDDEPFEADRLVRVHGTPEAHPELEAEHRPLLREVRRGQPEEQGGRMRAAGGRLAEA